MQPEAAGGERTAGKIALHLRLVGPEIGEREEKAAEQTRPKGVASLEIEGEIDRIQFPHLSRRRKRPRETRSQPANRWRIMPKATRHPGEDDGHLPFLRVADGSCSAGGRIDDDKKTGKQDR